MENNALYLSLLINLFVSILKFWGGVFFNAFTLTIDGIYTFSDFLTDVLALLGIKISKKRANKNHPLGYGRIFYVIEMFIGIIAVIVGFLIIYISVKIEYKKPSIYIIFVIILAVLLKFFSSYKLIKVGEKKKSDLLIFSGKESKIEALASLLLIIIVILSQWIPKIDVFGGIIIATLLILQAFILIYQNIGYLVGIVDNDVIIRKKIEEVVSKYKVINIVNISLLKIGPYYQVILFLKVDNKLKVNKVVLLQNKIKKELKAKSLNLKFISFQLV